MNNRVKGLKSDLSEAESASLRQIEAVVDGLWPWQVEALSRWQSNDNRGIVQVVTGGGKTRFALACIASWISERDDHCLVIVPTLALQDQWVVALEDDLLIPRDQIAVWGESNDLSRQFHVMVVNTARDKARLVASSSKRLLLIADECHRYASPENANSLKGEASATLGLTATARREHDDGLNAVLIPLLGELIFDYSIVDASKDGVVSPFELTNVQVPLLPSEEEQMARLTMAIGRAAAQNDDEKVKALAIKRSAVSKKAASRLPVTARIAEEHATGRVLIFHESIESAELITRILQQRGTPALAYHSRIAPEVRRDNLRLFKSGVVPVLVSCRALDEGIDVPEVSVAIISAATSSQRQRIQRLGRALRKADGKALAEIYTLYATSSEGAQLRVESERLSDVAKVTWNKVSAGA